MNNQKLDILHANMIELKTANIEGGLFISNIGSQYYWALSNGSNTYWKPITKELYLELEKEKISAGEFEEDQNENYILDEFSF